MACGLPIISSNLPFNDDVLNESNSIRVNPKSIKDIREAIFKLYNDANERKRLVEKSAESAQLFSIQKRVRNILLFIDSCIRERE